jgi:Cu/Ag efflux pump CusA
MRKNQIDAIPDLSENQVIIYTEWMGRSPQLIEDQITYPLVSNLQGIPKVKNIRGSSMFGMSFIYVIFEDNTDIYWARTRVMKRLSYAQ